LPQLLILVLNDPEKLPQVLKAWESLEVPGATVMDSIGYRRLTEYLRRDDVPLIPSLETLLRSEKVHHSTILAVLPDEKTVEAAVAAAERITGPFAHPHTGIAVSIPVTRVWGRNFPD
jgi:hypothetical protein